MAQQEMNISHTESLDESPDVPADEWFVLRGDLLLAIFEAKVKTKEG